jgi:hypothetical protein
MQGSILPGCSKHFTFTFVSHASGTYVEDWEISSLPAVPATQHRVTLRGVSVVDDLDTGDAAAAADDDDDDERDCAAAAIA